MNGRLLIGVYMAEKNKAENYEPYGSITQGRHPRSYPMPMRCKVAIVMIPLLILAGIGAYLWL